MTVKDALRKMFPHASSVVLQAMATTFPAARKKYNLNENLLSLALGQTHVESGGLTRFSENLHYTEAGLLRIYGVGRSSAKITSSEARRLAENPEAIAKRVYGTGKKAHDLGNLTPQDGWDFRGGGPIQITGRITYNDISKITGIDFVNNPDMARNPVYFWDIIFGFYHWKGAIHYMHDNQVTTATIEHISKVTNGGYTALEEREEATKRIYALVRSTKILTLESDDETPEPLISTPTAVIVSPSTAVIVSPSNGETPKPIPVKQDDVDEDDVGKDDNTVKASDKILAEDGDRDNPHVLKLQTGMNDLHYWSGTPDGDFEGLTRSALLAYQADNGFEPESMLRAKHLDRLEMAQPRQLSDGRRNASSSDISDSFTVRISKRLQIIATTGLGYMGVDASTDKGWAGIASSVFGEHDTITEFLRPIFEFVSSPTHLKIVIVLCSVTTIVMVYYIIEERLSNHKNAANLHR